ncbi:MAG: hypothetical protein KatS3mg043_1683 [Rhodothermaceae bacterium]|nr:MAG: hypothetical protein KatS3mg043_1683 [Rhodothermaceae bacterium]
MAAWIWVLIPLAALLLGGFSEWLKFKAKQQQLGASTGELEASVASLETQLAAAERRLRNLEAIVTSQLWDVLHDGSLSGPEKERALAAARAELHLPDEESDADRVEQMARRLRV